MIKACLLKDEYIKSIQIFKDMLRNGICPDNYTLPYVLKTCAKMKRLDLGELIHGYCLKLGSLFDNYVGNTMILMYSAFDDMEAAKCVFDEFSWHRVVSWTVLISGYAKIGDVYTARLVFDEVPLKDFGCNDFRLEKELVTRLDITFLVMHVKVRIPIVLHPIMVMGIVVIARKVMKEIHTSMMAVKIDTDEGETQNRTSIMK
ncbi:unnamed protein product [Fraxinus pennsylvanica]|uniref:Pentatricopeptide repeat-containing protein n=1 Tax=Fraxinus pennsylvanica TaxID=56036 RepID=A0AAD2E159_9LAMI|nr:unnamed protein product [Fraxinus pennsylvanica]